MGKKIVKIDGKTYVVDSDTKSMEEIETDEEKTVEEKDADTDKELKEAAKDVVSNLGIDKLFEQMSEINKKLDKPEEKEEKKAKELLDLEALMKKDIKEMTVREKVLGFFQAIVQNNKPVMKALSEGTAADGGLGNNSPRLNWVNCWKISSETISSQSFV
jgi:hypothetical protein